MHTIDRQKAASQEAIEIELHPMKHGFQETLRGLKGADIHRDHKVTILTFHIGDQPIIIRVPPERETCYSGSNETSSQSNDRRPASDGKISKGITNRD